MAAFKIIGVGHMGAAIAKGLCSSGLHDVALIDIDASKLEAFPGVCTRAGSALHHLNEHDAVILAIPPQAFPRFAAASPVLQGHTGLLLSVMAGLSVAHLSKALGSKQVVRSIPNTPSEVGWGMSVFYAGPDLSDFNLELCQSALAAIGEVLQVDREDLLDPATALCGGGPAFVACFLDALLDYALGAGFSGPDGLKMSLQVLRGTGELISCSAKLPQQICREVMTPQGTTERGIAKLADGQFKQLVSSALAASAQRSRELQSIVQG